jgi:hypothetical protein
MVGTVADPSTCMMKFHAGFQVSVKPLVAEGMLVFICRPLSGK